MTCPACSTDVQPDAPFCPGCDVLVGSPESGERATFPNRLYAMFWDVLLLMLLSLGAQVIAGQPGGGDLLYLGAALWIWLHFWREGQTPGKALLGLRVVQLRSEETPGLLRMFLRDGVLRSGYIVAFGIVSLWVFEGLGIFVATAVLFALAYCWALWDRNSQTWHDKIVGTIVLQQPQPAPDG